MTGQKIATVNKPRKMLAKTTNRLLIRAKGDLKMQLKDLPSSSRSKLGPFWRTGKMEERRTTESIWIGVFQSSRLGSAQRPLGRREPLRLWSARSMGSN